MLAVARVEAFIAPALSAVRTSFSGNSATGIKSQQFSFAEGGTMYTRGVADADRLHVRQ